MPQACQVCREPIDDSGNRVALLTHLAVSPDCKDHYSAQFAAVPAG